MRATAQRVAVYRALAALEHASAEDVCSHISEQMPETKISTASVYNILRELSDKGIFAARLSSSGKMHFDAIHREHFHLYDAQRDRFTNFEDEALKEIIENHFAGRRFKGYHIDSVDISVVVRPTTYNLRKKK